jgi:uncharacterized protein YlzI (FlbEa/FlbD family)
MVTDRQIQLNALKLVANSLNGKDFIIDPMDDEELKAFFDTITGAIFGMATVIQERDEVLYQLIIETVEQLSLR